MSLSARRAWIEIDVRPHGGVCPHGSLSARRAWIEILEAEPNKHEADVALRKESVD